jgi:GGDEF domain-containing protein
MMRERLATLRSLEILDTPAEGHLLALGTRFGHTVQLLHIHVERIAEIHRLHGSGQAERTLVEVTQVLLTCFRESDFAARTADDELRVLVSSGSAGAGDCGVKRIEDILQSLNSQRSQEQQVSVTPTVETYDPSRHPSLESLITADRGSLSGGPDAITPRR